MEPLFVKIDFKEINGEEHFKLTWEDEEDAANYCFIPIEEYHSYLKAVEIVRRRALQQIDKAKADEHGYTLLRADRRQYSYDSKLKAWLITMSSPYSVKLSLAQVTAMLNKDLRDFYGFCDLPLIETSDTYYADKGGKPWDVKDFLGTYHYNRKNKDRSTIHNPEYLQKLNFLDEHDWKIAFEISKIAKNHATGCYEVSYWATEPM